MIIHSPIISGSLEFASGSTFRLPDGGIYSGSFSGSIQVGEVQSHLVPNESASYDLGSPDFPYRDLYLSAETIKLGGLKIGGLGGKLSIKNNLNEPAELTAKSLRLGDTEETQAQIGLSIGGGLKVLDKDNNEGPLEASEIILKDTSGNGNNIVLTNDNGQFTTNVSDDAGTITQTDAAGALSGSFTGSIQDAIFNGDATFKGNLVPLLSASVDLGSEEFPFRDFYISAGTGHIGDNTISSLGGALLIKNKLGSLAPASAESMTLGDLEGDTVKVGLNIGGGIDILDKNDNKAAMSVGDLSVDNLTLDGTLITASGSEINYLSGVTSPVQGQLTTIENTVGAILSGSTADKDSFAEIVTLINSVDTTNDEAFASHYTSSRARLDNLESFSSSLDSEFATDSELTNLSSSLASEHFISDSRLASLESATGSIVTVQGIQDERLDSLESFSSSLDSGFVTEDELSSLSGSIETTISSHVDDTENPHSVTATQVGLSNVNNTADIDKPISTLTQNALDLKADDSDLTTQIGRIDDLESFSSSLDGGYVTEGELTTLSGSISSTITSLTTEDVTEFASALYYTDDRVKTKLDAEGVISGSSQILGGSGLVSGSSQIDVTATTNYSTVSSHIASTSNPHSVTATQVGLGNVDNTSDADKPISTATQTALDLKANDSDLTTHTGDTTNPHSVTATQVGLGNVTNESKATMFTSPTFTGTVSGVTATHVGLGNVDNTSDADKPISTATQTALDLKADGSDLTTHTGDTTNPHSVTATQVGLGNVTNESKATMFTSPTFTGTVSGVSKAMVGLGNVDNTSDADKPISTATQTALNGKQASGDYVTLTGNQTIGDTKTFNDIVVNGTGSFAYFVSTETEVNKIGQSFLVLNNDTPTERYAGLAVYDSGSTGVTSSMQFDGQTNDWFYEYSDDGGVTLDHGVVMFGPEYATKGSPVYNTNNTILKSNGGHHTLDSNISDDGTTISLGSNTNVTGSLTATTFVGMISGSSQVDLTATTNYVSGIKTRLDVEGVISGSSQVTITQSQVSDVTATAAELNILDGVTATTAEINKLDGVTATTAELNYVDGVTSNIQTQLNGKQASLGFTPYNATNPAGYTTYTSNQATNTTSAVTFSSVAGGTITGTSVSVTGDVVAYSSSDRRLKDNIVNIETPIEKVQKLNGVTWDWNDNADELQKSIANVGVIAQEVEEVLPQLVKDRENGYKGVDYAKLTGLLIEAVKEQQKQIDELKSRLG